MKKVLEDAAFVTDAATERTLVTVCKLRETLGSEVVVHFPVAASSARAADAAEFIEPLDDISSIFVARVHPQTAAREGRELRLAVDTKRLHFFEPESGLAIVGDGDHRRRPVGGVPTAAL